MVWIYLGYTVESKTPDISTREMVQRFTAMVALAEDLIQFPASTEAGS